MAKYVELPVEDLRTRVRFPPPPPIKRLTTSNEIQETRMNKRLRVFCCPNTSKLGCCNPTVTDGKLDGNRVTAKWSCRHGTYRHRNSQFAIPSPLKNLSSSRMSAGFTCC